MAPAPNAGRTRQAAAGKHAPKPLLPAIPLPYVKRQVATASSASGHPESSRNRETGNPTAESTRQAPAPAAQETNEAGRHGVNVAVAQTNGHSVTPESVGNRQEPQSQLAASTSTIAADPKTHFARHKSAPDADFETLAVVNATIPETTSQQMPVQSRSSGSQQPFIPPLAAPLGYQIPPPFELSGRPTGRMTNGHEHPTKQGRRPPTSSEVPNGVRFGSDHGGQNDVTSSYAVSQPPANYPPPTASMSGGRPPPHFERPKEPVSFGSITPDPHNRMDTPASPPNGSAPNQWNSALRPRLPAEEASSRGGNAGRYPPFEGPPPPNHPGPHHLMNGFPPVFNQSNSNFPMEGHSLPSNQFGPSTPHSFHDSQSSIHPEDHSAHAPFPPRSQINSAGSGGNDVPPHGYRENAYGNMNYPNMMPNPNFHPMMMPHADDADGLIGYLQQRFATVEEADCTLELRYLDDRAPPVRIPGHQLMFARSPELVQILHDQGSHLNPVDKAMHTVHMKTDNKWVRSDAFYMAVQRLYGLPLLPIPPPRNMLDTASFSVMSQVEFALGYAAAGHLLGWGPVVRRGCEVAAHLMSWMTLERCVEFALEGSIDTGAYEEFNYHEGSAILLSAAVNFIVHNLPLDLKLDTSPTPLEYSRLPQVPAHPATSSEAYSGNGMPASAKGVLGQASRDRRPPSMNGIHFGDLDLADERNGVADPGADRPEKMISHRVLSHVLPNLPFRHLRMILQSAGVGNVNGWANADSRNRIIRDVVLEREARRLRAVEAVVAGRVPNADSIRACLGSPEPRVLDSWGLLGWQEEMIAYGNADGPSLVRKWVPLAGVQPPSAASYV
ncbi:hypothetical protein S7711_03978 [Stachybotrys chartarum IBT 7711]|uniref:Uncharacterized protein n=1 Tax=Stachybotrys chartarum (strain CBS 109288 / IBT 7711) TaxID=1280523 RepID=A0A084AQZ8_STACB|nr:hypothetical protein S7711_03978 [Stachybotrys chartarum IBT 7711]